MQSHTAAACSGLSISSHCSILSCCSITLCSWASAASSCSHSSSTTADIAILRVWAGTVGCAGVETGGEVVFDDILKIELLNIELPRRIPASSDAGRDMMEVVEADRLFGSTLLWRSSLAVLTASSAPRSPGITESILCLAVPEKEVNV